MGCEKVYLSGSRFFSFSFPPAFSAFFFETFFFFSPEDRFLFVFPLTLFFFLFFPLGEEQPLCPSLFFPFRD